MQANDLEARTVINLVVVSLRGAPPAASRCRRSSGRPAAPSAAPTPTRWCSTIPTARCRACMRRCSAATGATSSSTAAAIRCSTTGMPLGSGNEALLADGDRLMIGSFELAVRSAAGRRSAAPACRTPPRAAARTDDDPFADLLAGLGAAGACAASAPAPRRACAASPIRCCSPTRWASGARAPAPRQRPRPPTTPSPTCSAAAPRPPSAARSTTSPTSACVAGRRGRRHRRPVRRQRRRRRPAAIRWRCRRWPIRCCSPTRPSDVDPFAALQGTPKRRRRAAQRPPADRRFGYTPPKGRCRRRAGVDPFADLLPPPAPRRPCAAPRASAAAPPAPAPVPRPLPPPATTRCWPPSCAASDSTHQMPEALTPELMERIGVLLRSATEGTLQLLLDAPGVQARGARRGHDDRGAGQQPAQVLAHGRGRAGAPARARACAASCRPEAAMRDAYDDLRAHEFGVMVGMRAALAHVIARFTPDELEKKIAAKSALDSLFAANRKAKLWDQFVALYAGIASRGRGRLPQPVRQGLPPGLRRADGAPEVRPLIEEEPREPRGDRNRHPVQAGRPQLQRRRVRPVERRPLRGLPGGRRRGRPRRRRRGGGDGAQPACSAALPAAPGAGRAPACARLVEQANLDVVARQAEGGKLAAMRSTVVLAASTCRITQLAWAHSGDSRAYLFRGGAIVGAHHRPQPGAADGGQRHDRRGGRAPASAAQPAAVGARLGARSRPRSRCPTRMPLRSGRRAAAVHRRPLGAAGRRVPARDAARLARRRAQWIEQLDAQVQARAKPGHDNYTAVTLWVREDDEDHATDAAAAVAASGRVQVGQLRDLATAEASGTARKPG